MIAVFVGMLIYFLTFEISGKSEVITNPLNNRTQNMEQTVFKGDVISSDNVVIATTQNAEDGTEYRLYPFGSLFAHTLGYTPMGGAGLEDSQKIKLLTSHNTFLHQLTAELLNQKIRGDTLHVTLSYALQSYCYDQLGGRNGTIIVMEPKTGKILAMVSCPDFDPSSIEEQWSSIVSPENTTGNLMNRGSQGLYAPGSTFKMITLLEYVRENPATWRDFSYNCSGSYEVEGTVIGCHEGHAHGVVDAYGALTLSCNGAFVEMSQSLDPVSWRELCEDFGYNQGFSMDVQYKKSRFSLTEDATAWDLAQASIGQGTTVTTPLLNTMITSAIANNGIMMKPYLVDSFTSDDKTYESVTQPVVLKQCITASEAAFLTQGMEYVVKDGSGYRAGSSFAQVAGKTGSAQYSSEAGRYHAWFTGFAPSDDPQIAVTVLIEGGGSGGEVAAPIAGNIFNYYFALQQSK